MIFCKKTAHNCISLRSHEFCIPICTNRKYKWGNDSNRIHRGSLRCINRFKLNAENNPIKRLNKTQKLSFDLHTDTSGA